MKRVIAFLLLLSSILFGTQSSYKSIDKMQYDCDNNISGVDCLMLSIYYKDGQQGLQADMNKSISYLDKACKMNVAVACYNLGNFYAKVKRDRFKALNLYHKACEKHIVNACYNFKILTEETKNTKK